MVHTNRKVPIAAKTAIPKVYQIDIFTNVADGDDVRIEEKGITII